MRQTYVYLIGGMVLGLAVAAGFAIFCHGAGAPATAVAHNGTVWLIGDTTTDQSIPVSGIVSLAEVDVPSLANRSGSVATRGVPVPAFLAARGVTGYDRLVVYADDYRLTINYSDVTGQMILVPDDVSVRILAGNLPINSWVKNIRYIVVVGGDNASSILLNGRKVTYGSILAGGIDLIPYYSQATGYLQNGTKTLVETSGIAEGRRLPDFLAKEGYAGFSNVTITCGKATESYSRAEVLSRGLFLTRFQGAIRLGGPDRLNAAWKAIDSIQVE